MQALGLGQLAWLLPRGEGRLNADRWLRFARACVSGRTRRQERQSPDAAQNAEAPSRETEVAVRRFYFDRRSNRDGSGNRLPNGVLFSSRLRRRQEFILAGCIAEKKS